MSLLPVRAKDLWGNGGTMLSELDRMQNEMDRWFSRPSLRVWDVPSGLQENGWYPSVDIKDSKDCLVVTADLPGLTKDNVDVAFEEGVLTIKGHKKEDKEVKEEGYIRRERWSGQFFRAIPIPSTIDEKSVKASFKDGVLEVVLTKKEEAKAKQIKVEVK